MCESLPTHVENEGSDDDQEEEDEDVEDDTGPKD